MSTTTMPAVSQCTVTSCSYNHDGCHAFAITVTGAGSAADCATFVPLSDKGGLSDVVAQVGACSRTDCVHNADLECTADAITVGAGSTDNAATCLTYTAG